jgi:Cys-tRNA synthase (O-phospho-L-seryl-tRNA:Cys-tRNA synthase)
MQQPTRPVIEIVREFNSIIVGLITLMRSKVVIAKRAAKTPEEVEKTEIYYAHVNRIAARLATIMQASETAVIERSHEAFLSYKDQILARDETFFISKEVRDLTEKEIDGLDQLLEYIKMEYFRCTPAEKEDLQNKSINLLKTSVEYKLTRL